MRARAGFIRPFVLAVLVLSLAATARAQDRPAYKPGEVLVKFRSWAQPARVRSLTTAVGGDVVRTFPKHGIVRMTVSSGTVEQAIAVLRADPAVEFAEPNWVLHAIGIPNDPLFPQLWGLQNTGQTGGIPGADIHAPQAWSTTTGSSSVLVGVIDTGIDYTHPDLAANIWTNPGEIPGNNRDDDGNGFIDDIHGWDFVNNDNDPMDDHYHGTHCAGTIGAVGDNGIGVAGVNWTVKIAAIKFLDAGGSGYTDAAIAAIDYAATIGVKVINASWGGGEYSEALRTSIAAAGDAGALFCAAAGNSAINNDFSPHYPSSYDVDAIIAVAATDSYDQLTFFSNYGAQSVDIAAPGQDILSTAPNNGYQYLSGTSMATPHVAGVAALLRGRFPGMNVAATKQILMVRSQKLASLTGKVLSGGRLDALGAVSDPDSTAPAAVDDLAADDANGTRVRLRWTATGDDGLVGTAFAYDVRYSNAPIDAGNFDAATPASLEPSPGAAGSPEEMVVQGLSFSTGYHFALRVADEFGNVSAVSNDASATTLGPPDVAVVPDTLSADLLTGASTTSFVTVSNSGPGELVFSVERQTLDAAGTIDVLTAHDGVTDRVIATGHPVPLVTLAGIPRTKTVSPGEYAEPDKNGVMKHLATGPGRTVLGHDEEVFGGTQNGFYGGPRTRGNVFHCTEGRRLREHRFFLDVPIPTQMWFLVYEGLAPTGNFSLVSASDVSPAGPGQGWFSSGEIDLELVEGRYYMIVTSFEQPAGYYNQEGINPYPIPASFGSLVMGVGWSWSPFPSFPPTAGVDVPDFAYGDPVAYYQTIVTDDLVTWISAAPESGVVAGFGSLQLAVKFDATGLNDGNYESRLILHTNDPDEPEVPIGAHLHVTGAADIALVPDSLDFGSPFVGAVLADTVEVRNIGTASLVVTGITPQPAAYTADFTGAFALAPGEKRKVAVHFAPAAPGDHPGTLRVDSTDPDRPEAFAVLAGTALVAPVMGVTPDSLSADLLTGEQATRTVTVTNTGGSDLTIQVSTRGVPGAQARIVVAPPEAPDPGANRSNRYAPREYRPTVAPRHVTAGAKVLLVQDVLPWGLNSVEQVLAQNAIPYDAIGTAQLASTDLTHYDVMIFPSDQYYSSYLNLASRSAQINAFVQQGGRLEYHAAGYGFNGGEPTLYTLPGGMTVVGDFPGTNVVLLPDHPIAENVPNPFSGNAASHVRFLNIPASAQLILGNDTGLPNCVQYGFGAGLVVASGQTLEWGYVYGQGSGQVLRNMIPYVVSGASGWLSAAPQEGVVPPGQSALVTVTFDATDLEGGVYHAFVHIESNDPLASEIDIPARLSVTGVPDVALRGRAHTVVSSQTFNFPGSSTHHVLTLPTTPGSDGRMNLTAEGDFNEIGETATLVVEGQVIGHVGEHGYECYADSGKFDLSNAQLVQFGADRSVDLTVANSPTVDAYCYTNRHTVRLSYRDRSDRLELGMRFLGTCARETLEVANTGTDSLRLDPPVPSHAWYTATLGSLLLAPHTSTSLIVTFCPLAAGDAEATLALTSNDPDEGNLAIALGGAGAIAPDIAVAGDLLEVTLDTGAKATLGFNIANTGGPLLWSARPLSAAPPDSVPPPPDSVIVEITQPVAGIAHAKEESSTLPPLRLAAARSSVTSPEPLPEPPSQTGTLESVLAGLDAHAASVTAAIPNRFDFSEGFYGYAISDGGNDMYDGGNYLFTDLGGYLLYSDGTITWDYPVGPNGKYFTRKYPGLFVFAADLDGLQQFVIGGNLGADGLGLVDGAVIDIVHGGPYRLFLKRVYSAGDPSVNHLIIVPGGQTASHIFDPYTDSDYHWIYGPGKRIYYLLYAGNNGAYIDNASAIAIARAFLNAIPGNPVVSVSPKSGGVPGGGETAVHVTFDAKGLFGGDYPGRIEITSNDPDENPVYVPTLLHVHGVADIAAVPESLDFGPRFLGVPAQDSVFVRNEGTDVLHVSAVSAQPAVFQVAPSAFPLAAGEQKAIPVKFIAAAAGPVSGTLSISSDDTDEPVLLVPLRGTGVQGVPEIAVDPVNLQFGERFVGVSVYDTVRVFNFGTAMLHVTGAAAAPSEFGVAPDSFLVAPGTSHAMAVRFMPSAPGPIAGALTIYSDDADEPSVLVTLNGTGMVPPTLVISPDSLSASVAPGGQAVKVLTVSNPGSADLLVSIAPHSLANAALRAVPNEPLAARTPSSRAPTGYQAVNPQVEPMAGAKVLLVQDVLPFGAPSNQAVLSLNGIPYDQVTTTQLASKNLSSYFAVIVASDQFTSSYQNLVARSTQIATYVQQGGRLEFHAACFGFHNGNSTLVTLPGGMHIEVDTASVNRVLMPGHPIAAGVPDPFTGNLASHVRFASIPAGAQLILGNAIGLPNLVSYAYGAGLVVASGQALENGYQYGEASGRVLENMIPFVADVPSWLRTAPNSATVPPGQHLDVQVIFDAASLVAGFYSGQLVVASNDPIRPSAQVPAMLTVLGASAVTGTEDDDVPVFGLAAVTPTPAHVTARVQFTLTRPGPARAAIYDVAGRLVKTLVDGPQEAGRHAVVWTGMDERGAKLSAGVYLLRLDSAEGRRTRRVVWVP